MARDAPALSAPATLQVARRRSTAATQVWAQLRSRIVLGELLPGQRLSENDLASSLGLSRTPVREAFIKLVEEGLLAVYPQYGTFVAPIRIRDVHDSQFVREALECAALAKLAAAPCPEDVGTLRALLAVQQACLSGEPKPFFDADERFHATLMRLAGHARAWSVVEAAKCQHDRVRCFAVRLQPKREAIYQEHAEVVDRLAQGDGVGATAAMQLHLRAVFSTVESIIEQHPEYFESAAEAPDP